MAAGQRPRDLPGRTGSPFPTAAQNQSRGRRFCQAAGDENVTLVTAAGDQLTAVVRGMLLHPALSCRTEAGEGGAEQGSHPVLSRGRVEVGMGGCRELGNRHLGEGVPLLTTPRMPHACRCSTPSSWNWGSPQCKRLCLELGGFVLEPDFISCTLPPLR